MSDLYGDSTTWLHKLWIIINFVLPLMIGSLVMVSLCWGIPLLGNLSRLALLIWGVLFVLAEVFWPMFQHSPKRD